MYAGWLGRDIILDMMPDDIPHTDDKARKKCHPLAKWCLIISLSPVIFFTCLLGMQGVPDSPSAPMIYFHLLSTHLCLTLFRVSLWGQSVGILMGLYSLVLIYEGRSYYGKRYAIPGIVISGIIFFVWLLIFWAGGINTD